MSEEYFLVEQIIFSFRIIVTKENSDVGHVYV